MGKNYYHHTWWEVGVKMVETDSNHAHFPYNGYFQSQKYTNCLKLTLKTLNLTIPNNFYNMREIVNFNSNQFTDLNNITVKISKQNFGKSSVSNTWQFSSASASEFSPHTPNIRITVPNADFILKILEIT